MKKLCVLFLAAALAVAGCVGFSPSKPVLKADYLELTYNTPEVSDDFTIRRVEPAKDFTIVDLTHERRETHGTVPVRTVVFDEQASIMGFEHYASDAETNEETRYCGIMWFTKEGFEMYRSGTFEEIDNDETSIRGGRYVDCDGFFAWLNEELAK